MADPDPGVKLAPELTERGLSSPGLRVTWECMSITGSLSSITCTQPAMRPRRKPAVSELASQLLWSPLAAHLWLPGRRDGCATGALTPHSPQGPTGGGQPAPRR